MSQSPSGNDPSYLRVAVITSDHPGKPLAGTVVSITTGHEIEIDTPDDPFDGIFQEAQERFDISSYAEGLRLATVYVTKDTNEFVGVKWESQPKPYSHGDFEDMVSDIPDDVSLFASSDES